MPKRYETWRNDSRRPLPVAGEAIGHRARAVGEGLGGALIIEVIVAGLARLHVTHGDQAVDAVDNPVKQVTLDGVDTMTYDAANQLLSEYHPIAGVKTWSFDPVGNRLNQDFTQVGVRTLTN